MKVEDVEVSEAVIERAVAEVCDKPFVFAELRSALHQSGVDVITAYRCADRALQKLRKAGRIEFIDSRWQPIPHTPA